MSHSVPAVNSPEDGNSTCGYLDSLIEVQPSSDLDKATKSKVNNMVQVKPLDLSVQIQKIQDSG